MLIFGQQLASYSRIFADPSINKAYEGAILIIPPKFSSLGLTTTVAKVRFLNEIRMFQYLFCQELLQ